MPGFPRGQTSISQHFVVCVGRSETLQPAFPFRPMFTSSRLSACSGAGMTVKAPFSSRQLMLKASHTLRGNGVNFWGTCRRRARSWTVSCTTPRPSPGEDLALRVSSQGHNDYANRKGLTFFPNMRAPIGSPIHHAYASGEKQNAIENLANWQTSSGKSFAAITVFTSACHVNGRVYAVLSI